jgi:hypothetical protein
MGTMKVPPVPTEPIPKPGFVIFTCNTAEELSSKVSEALKDGTMFLHGQPFVFKDQMCQAVKFASNG